MKKPWIKWCLLGLEAFIALIGIPILINECYKAGGWYITIWEAADVLSYYGTVISSAIAVATIAVTISFNRKQIQRESYLKSENDKWKAIESEIVNVLDRINPQRVFAVGIDRPSASNDAFSYILSSLQKYQMDCRTAADKLIALLSSEDYPRVEALFTQIQQASDIFFNICDEEHKIYGKIRDLGNKDTFLRLLEIEKNAPNTFPQKDIDYCLKELENMSNLKPEELWEKLGILNQKMVDSYTVSYRNLFALKRQTFDSIYAEIQKNADEILHFGRK